MSWTSLGTGRGKGRSGSIKETETWTGIHKDERNKRGEVERKDAGKGRVRGMCKQGDTDGGGGHQREGGRGAEMRGENAAGEGSQAETVKAAAGF